METSQPQDLQNWLFHVAHLAVKGHPFNFKDCFCLPVSMGAGTNAGGQPCGFLLTHGTDVELVSPENPEWDDLSIAWEKERLMELMAENSGLPSECWLG